MSRRVFLAGLLLVASLPQAAEAKKCETPESDDVKQVCEASKVAQKLLANVEQLFIKRQPSGPLAGNAAIYHFGTGCEDNKALTGEISVPSGTLELFVQSTLRFVRLHMEENSWEAANLSFPAFDKQTWQKAETLSLKDAGKIQVYQTSKGIKVAFHDDHYWWNITKSNGNVEYRKARRCRNEGALRVRLTNFLTMEVYKPFIVGASRKLLNNPDTAEAKAIIAAAPDINPGSSDIRGLNALVLAYEGKSESALLEASVALNFDPKSAWAKFARGVANERLGFTEKARNDYADAIGAKDVTLQFAATRALERMSEAPKIKAKVDETLKSFDKLDAAIADTSACNNNKRLAARVALDAFDAAYQTLRDVRLDEGLSTPLTPLLERATKSYTSLIKTPDQAQTCNLNTQAAMIEIKGRFKLIGYILKSRGGSKATFAAEREWTKKWLSEIEATGVVIDE